MLSNTNIAIIKCYKYILQYNYFIKCTGGFIILCLIFIQIIFTIVYCSNSLYYIRKYIFSISNKYLIYITKEKMNYNRISNDFPPNFSNKPNPPKKIEKVGRDSSQIQTDGRKNIKNSKKKGRRKINNKNSINKLIEKNDFLFKKNFLKDNLLKSKKQLIIIMIIIAIKIKCF